MLREENGSEWLVVMVRPKGKRHPIMRCMAVGEYSYRCAKCKRGRIDAVSRRAYDKECRVCGYKVELMPAYTR